MQVKILLEMFGFSVLKGSPSRILETEDRLDREVEFVPTKAPYDPRWMLNGRQNQGNFSLEVVVNISLSLSLMVVLKKQY